MATTQSRASSDGVQDLAGSVKHGIPWPRILAEGLVIVVSILLAFGIDAWWDGQQERARRVDLLADLQSDFLATRELLAEAVVRGETVVAGSQGFYEWSFGGLDRVRVYSADGRLPSLGGSGWLRRRRDR